MSLHYRVAFARSSQTILIQHILSKIVPVFIQLPEGLALSDNASVITVIPARGCAMPARGRDARECDVCEGGVNAMG
jgi:hypothetical protein